MENDQISDQNSFSICSLCQMTFPSYEEILVHTCVEIKEDKIEEIIGHSEIIANDQLVDLCDQEDFKNKSSFSCLDLTEEFLIFILKQVDDLKTGHLKKRQIFFTTHKMVQMSNLCIINGLHMHQIFILEFFELNRVQISVLDFVLIEIYFLVLIL